MAEFNSVVGEFCVQRTYTPPRPPTFARTEPRDILVVDEMAKVRMPDQDLIVHQKFTQSVPVGPEPVTVERKSIGTVYYIIVKILQAEDLAGLPINVNFQYDFVLSTVNIAPGAVFAVPTTAEFDPIFTLQSGNYEIDVLLIGTKQTVP